MLPVHPSIVHFPIVFGVLLPIVAVGAILLIRRGAEARIIWAVAFVLCAALTASTFAANRSGEQDEEIVEEVVSENYIEAHEEAGERYLWLSGVALAFAALGFAPGKAGSVGRGATAIGGVALMVAALQVGHLGGELVYEHGAASAHVARGEAGDAASGGEPAPGGDDGRDDREDHSEDDD